MRQEILGYIGKEGVVICSLFAIVMNILAIIILTAKAYAERMLPETPLHINECGEPVYTKVDRVTGYSPTVGQTDSTPTITATNRQVRVGIVAISGNLEEIFPMNSSLEFWIEGKKYLVQVEDRMNKRKRNQIDLFFWKTKEAKEFGVHRNIIIWRQE